MRYFGLVIHSFFNQIIIYIFMKKKNEDMLNFQDYQKDDSQFNHSKRNVVGLYIHGAAKKMVGSLGVQMLITQEALSIKQLATPVEFTALLFNKGR